MENLSSTPAMMWRPSTAPPISEQPPLSAVYYRSRAVRSLSPTDLQDLTLTSQARNGREAITGVMVYDDGRFFQWLEGPADSVGRVMNSISSDPRHSDIEVLKSQTAHTRRFADCSMKLATQRPNLAGSPREVIEAPPHIVEDLHQRPEAAPDLLVKLVAASVASSADSAVSDALTQLPMKQRTAAILKRVMLAKVVPELVQACDARSIPLQVVPVSARVEELADLLIGQDQSAAVELIRELRGSVASIAPLCSTLLEPAARRLGDLWTEDLCSEFDVTLGLLRLQSAIRLLTDGALRSRPGTLPTPVVLIAPLPGELHRLGAALDNSVLERAGWSPHCEYPADDHALQDLLADTWFDVLDLSLSAAFRREDWLPRMTGTISEAREASRNPALVVVVGGRIFMEDRKAGLQVGADLATTTALSVDRAILRTMSTTGTSTATPAEQIQATATAS